MKRFAVPRVAHCSSGHTQVPGTTENCLHLGNDQLPMTNCAEMADQGLSGWETVQS
jgi:hypothetical protein